MWSHSQQGGSLVISLDLGFSRVVSAIKVYNYNGSVNESFRGVKHLTVFLDSTRNGIGFTCRKAPACDGFDYCQLLDLTHKQSQEPASVRPCTCLLYTSDAADEEDSVDLGGRRIIKKKKKKLIGVGM
eukprot:TRINITY_DN6368_c0_g1_i1.p1 TRINITY_DN6368_c0_g1~~TRINITY_DN6368_c0_g1_i1.p1  ORF type:complete len:128 (-),score=33.84 TRINITY_DN6368_c0_g1_i1:37-420(-)